MELILIQIIDAWRRGSVLAKLMSFASIGVLNVAVDATVFTVAYKLLQLPLIMSNVLAWAVAVTGSYAMNTKITFGRETGGAFSWRHYLRFAASGILGVIVATTTLVVLSHYASVLTSKLVSIVAAFGVNFSMSHFVVFRGNTADAKRP
ncbi:GtrA family protein [Bradyrhizobium algeriense]|uniref:GtrA family protein n=1 Tax=Bradyrhizobium algeriense TaxID=634784 RepID=UPI000D37ED15|nr:GtrA family protein [Bradyrhizobium algeriense]